MAKAKTKKAGTSKSSKTKGSPKAPKELVITVKGERQSPESINRMKQDLDAANTIIHKCLDSFLDVLVQLTIVREKELWRVGGYKKNNGDTELIHFKTFEQYTEYEFGFKRAYLSRLRKAGETYKWLQDKDVDKTKALPQHPAFYMTLSEIPEVDRIETIEKWETEPGKRTANKLIKVWEELKGEKLEKPPKETDYKKKIKSVLGVLVRLNKDILSNQYKQVDEESLQQLKDAIDAIQKSLN